MFPKISVIKWRISFSASSLLHSCASNHLIKHHNFDIRFNMAAERIRGCDTLHTGVRIESSLDKYRITNKTLFTVFSFHIVDSSVDLAMNSLGYCRQGHKYSSEFFWYMNNGRGTRSTL